MLKLPYRNQLCLWNNADPQDLEPELQNNTNGDYKLITCNCLQQSTDALLLGKLADGTKVSDFFQGLSSINSVRPNSAYGVFSRESGFMNTAFTKEGAIKQITVTLNRAIRGQYNFFGRKKVAPYFETLENRARQLLGN